MKQDSLIRQNLAMFIEYLAVPALTVSLSADKILAVNSLLVRSHGQLFSEMIPVVFKKKKISSVGESGFLKITQESPLELEFCSEQDAEFCITLFTSTTAVIFQKISAHSEMYSFQRPLENKVKDEMISADEPFHFSYIYNPVTGTFTCSDNELFVRLGLVEKVQTIDWRSFICEEDLEFYDNTLENVRLHGGNHEIHYRIKKLDGHMVSVCDYCAITEPDGKWPVLVGSIVSSGRSDVEVSMVEKQVLVGRLVGGMVHDFKNLLGGIQNIIEWSVSQPMENKDVTDALRKTLVYTEQATDLISGALKVSSGKSQGKIEKIYIENIINDLEELITRVIPASVAVSISIESDLPPIYGEQSKLKDMILNLCVNARDAMEKQGDVLKIETYLKVAIDEHQQAQKFVALAIEDNGCGMSKQQIQSVFDAFYSTKETGAGLGLWMVREAVRAFDGGIDVRSKEGGGTVFEVLFPVIEHQNDDILDLDALEAKPVQFETSSENIFENLKLSGTILYIEDEPLIRSGVETWLRGVGLDLLVAENGTDGWELFLQNKDEIKLILQDWVLPGKRGDQLLVDFLKEKPDLPVIVATANTDDDMAEELIAKGAYAFVAKPFKMEELLSIFKAVFDHL